MCAKDVFLHLHYSVWLLTGSCPDVPAVSALLSVKQCSQRINYANDAVLFAQDPGRWQAELKRFDDAATTMDLHTSWVKTQESPAIADKPARGESMPTMLQIDVLTTLSLTILVNLHSFSCCCVLNLRNTEKFSENSNL